jgi:hypothetical protein
MQEPRAQRAVFDDDQILLLHGRYAADTGCASQNEHVQRNSDCLGAPMLTDYALLLRPLGWLVQRSCYLLSGSQSKPASAPQQCSHMRPVLRVLVDTAATGASAAGRGSDSKKGIPVSMVDVNAYLAQLAAEPARTNLTRREGPSNGAQHRAWGPQDKGVPREHVVVHLGVCTDTTVPSGSYCLQWGLLRDFGPGSGGY